MIYFMTITTYYWDLAEQSKKQSQIPLFEIKITAGNRENINDIQTILELQVTSIPSWVYESLPIDKVREDRIPIIADEVLIMRTTILDIWDRDQANEIADVLRNEYKMNV